MAVRTMSLLNGSRSAALLRSDSRGKVPDAHPFSLRSQAQAFPMHTFAAPLSSSKLQQMGTQVGSSPYFGHVLPAMKRPGVLHGRAQRVKTLTTAATSGGPNGSPDSSESSAKSRTRAKEDVASLREKLNNYIEKKAGYFWLSGPLVTTAAVVIPPALISIVDLLQKNYWLGLVATFGLDVLFVLAADLFFVLSDKAGHQQAIAGGPPPWIGPWEYTGYPKGEPTLTKYISYAGVAIGLLGLVTSLFLGKLAVGLPALGSYLALIFIQVAYERLLSSDRVPAYPLVPIVYTVYRFKQLARGMELVAAMGGGVSLAATIRLLMVIWTFYLGMQLTQIPWLYSTWNSNRAT